MPQFSYMKIVVDCLLLSKLTTFFPPFTIYHVECEFNCGNRFLFFLFFFLFFMIGSKTPFKKKKLSLYGPAGPVKKPICCLWFRVGWNPPTLSRTLGFSILYWKLGTKPPSHARWRLTSHSGKSHLLTLCLVPEKSQEYRKRKLLEKLTFLQYLLWVWADYSFVFQF